jgi:hypothetical protein
MIKKIPYLLVVVFIVSLFLLPLAIKVRIVCKSQFGDCPADIVSNLNTLNSKNLYDTRQKVSSYLKKTFLVSDFSIQFKLPNLMVVSLIIKKPIFALKNISTGKIELIDENGAVIAQTDNSNLPTLVTSEPIKNVGESVDDRDLFTLHLISGINDMYQVGYGTIVNDALVVDIPNGVRVIFPLEGDPEILLGALRLIYAKVTASYLGIYSQIDMRYKNPVLR